ncbi:MAG: protein kinase [Anaerolineales bacterium]|nr:protein kinase [Anaerolineales bacterium]
MNTSGDLQLEAYTLVEELSQNDIMTVYRAERQTDGAPVIVKVLSPLLAADEFLARRFKLAAQQMAKLEHPNIVRSYEAGQEGERLYWVQDFVRATPLAQVLHTEGSLAPQRMQFIARQIASALDYAHQNLLRTAICRPTAFFSARMTGSGWPTSARPRLCLASTC